MLELSQQSRTQAPLKMRALKSRPKLCSSGFPRRGPMEQLSAPGDVCSFQVTVKVSGGRMVPAELRTASARVSTQQAERALGWGWSSSEVRGQAALDGVQDAKTLNPIGCLSQKAQRELRAVAKGQVTGPTF